MDVCSVLEKATAVAVTNAEQAMVLLQNIGEYMINSPFNAMPGKP